MTERFVLGVRSSRWLVAGALLAAMSLACGTETTRPRVHSISGSVRLEADGRDAAGNVVGTFYIPGVSGVPVYLYRAGSLLDSTRTSGGAYLFRGLRNGVYRLIARLANTMVDTLDVSVAGADSSFTEWLTLGSLGNGDVVGTPNPLSGRVILSFRNASSDTARLVVVSPSGALIRTLADRPLALGLHEFLWDARDDSNQPVPNGPYCVVLTQGTEVRLVILYLCSDSSCWPPQITEETRETGDNR